MTGIASGIADSFMDALFNSVTWSEPPAVYIKLHIGNPGSAGTSNAASETTRKLATFTTSSFGYVETSADLNWINVAATETYSYWTAWDASSGGNFLFSDQFQTPISVNAGQDFSILTADISVQLNNIA